MQRPARRADEAKQGKNRANAPPRQKRRGGSPPEPDKDKERYRIEVGHTHGVKPGNIVGAITNEAGLDGEHIGHIDIETEFSLVDLPVGMPKNIFMDLKKVRVCGRSLNISRHGKSENSRKKKSKKRRKPPAA